MKKDNFHFVIRDITHHELVQLVEYYEFYLKMIGEKVITLEEYYKKFTEYKDGKLLFKEVQTGDKGLQKERK